MKALRTHVAGVDVHKDMLAITILIGAGDECARWYLSTAETIEPSSHQLD